MKILFIYQGGENIGIEYLSSYLKRYNHEVRLLFDPDVYSGSIFLKNRFFKKITNIDNKIINQSLLYNPDFICFSTLTSNYKWNIHIARKLKEVLPSKIVFGGIHVTALPDHVLNNDCVDFILVGESEEALLELVEGKPYSDILNLGYKKDNKIIMNNIRPLQQNIDIYPFPDKDLFYDKSKLLSKYYRLLTSRGCPYSCSFCSNSLLQSIYKGKKYRSRSVNNVIQELIMAKNKYKIDYILISDELFGLNLDWLKEFSSIYKKEISIPYICQLNPNILTDERVSLMKDSGCKVIYLGVQSGSEKIRNGIFKRIESNEKIINSCNLVKKYNISLYIDIIYGCPEETEHDLNATIDLVKEIRPNKVSIFFLCYFPETNILKYALEKNYLTLAEHENIKNGVEYQYTYMQFKGEKYKLYSYYRLLLQFSLLIKNNIIFNLLRSPLKLIPFKDQLSRLLTFINGLFNFNLRYLYFLQYTFSKKNIP